MPRNFTKENAKANGSKGGYKSGTVRRNKRDAREAAAMLMQMAATGSIKQQMEKLGYEEDDSTYMNGLMVKLYLLAMDGNLDALDRLMKISGYDPEENRKEAESMAMIKQKNVELQIRVKELEMKMKQATGIDMENDSSDDVMIYLPAVETETDIEDLNKEFEEATKEKEEEVEYVTVMEPTTVEAESQKG